MKIIKNLKYFLMLGCLSFATFTFAETTANQNADKQAVQKQLSKKLNDLSIHIKTLENMLKVINANDLNNNMTNRLGELETKINGLTTNLNNASNIITSHTSTLADLEERIDSIDDDIKTTREVLSNVSSDASTALKKANTALETANLAKSNAKTACDNADLAYNTAITAKDYAFDALNKANTAQSNVKTAFDNADLANNTANIALNKANNLTTSYNSLSTKVSNLESSIKTMEVDVSKLNESLGYDIDTIKKIQNDITDLDTKFDRLQRIGSPIKIHWENIRADSKPSALRYNDDTDPTSNRLLGGKIIRGDGRFLPDVMVPITAGVLTNEIEIVTNTTTQATRILDQDYLRILYSNFHKNSLLIPFTSGGKNYDSMLYHSHLSGKLHGTNITVNTIPGDALQARTVTSAKLANNAVTTNNISPTEFKKIMHSPAYISDPHRTSDYCVVDPNHASATDDQFDTDSSKPYTTLTRAFEVSSRKGDNINVVVVVPKDKSRMFFFT